ncbi:MAG: hypothetical protein LCH61_18555 [Proteobacteria bacterium]|nr:hypothetical protein [Pseudomonadota bacterium]
MNGVHLHVGSQNPDPHVYTQAFVSLFESLKTIFEETGTRLTHLNLGGGFPVDYLSQGDTSFPDEQQEMLSANFEPADAIRTAWNAVTQAATEANAHDLLDNLTVLIEPGRSIIADTTVKMPASINIWKAPL